MSTLVAITPVATLLKTNYFPLKPCQTFYNFYSSLNFLNKMKEQLTIYNVPICFDVHNITTSTFQKMGVDIIYMVHT